MSKLSRQTGRMIQKLSLGLHGHILNPFWRDRDYRRRKRYEATATSVLGYLSRYKKAIRDCNPPAVSTADEPERAFTIWFQGEENAPELVKACFRSMRRNLTQELVVIDEKSIFSWISLPDYIIDKWRKGLISHTHFSDICRVELLYEHGGLWLDSTNYMTSPVPEYIMNEDFFVYMAGNRIRGNYGMIQNCFIRSRKGNRLLGVWRDAMFAYWKEEDDRIDYFVHQLLFRLSVETNEDARSLFTAMPKVDQDPTHALWEEHCTDTYDKEGFERLTSGAFFQKTSYKDERLKSAAPDSIAAYMMGLE